MTGVLALSVVVMCLRTAGSAGRSVVQPARRLEIQNGFGLPRNPFKSFLANGYGWRQKQACFRGRWGRGRVRGRGAEGELSPRNSSSSSSSQPSVTSVCAACTTCVLACLHLQASAPCTRALGRPSAPLSLLMLPCHQFGPYPDIQCSTVQRQPKQQKHQCCRKRDAMQVDAGRWGT
eukprot:1137360-Pelagomonas_calceolata.AAC.8